MNDTQTANSFDAASVEKVKKGFLIATAGLLVTVLPVLGSQVSDSITSGQPIDWAMIFGMCVASLSTAVVNAIKEWLAGNKE